MYLFVFFFVFFFHLDQDKRGPFPRVSVAYKIYRSLESDFIIFQGIFSRTVGAKNMIVQIRLILHEIQEPLLFSLEYTPLPPFPSTNRSKMELSITDCET